MDATSPADTLETYDAFWRAFGDRVYREWLRARGTTVVDHPAEIPAMVTLRRMTKDWRVLYAADNTSRTRSKPFDTEDQALAWAISWLKDEGPDAHPTAHVLHRTQVEPELAQLDPTPRSHRVSWAPVGDQLRMVKRTWPSQSLADHEAESLRVVAEMGKPDGARVYTEWELVDDMALRAL